MPNVSMVVKAEDRASTTFRKMAASITPFRKDVDLLEDELKTLNSSKFQLKLDLSDAQKELKSLADAYKKTGEGAEDFRQAQERFDQISTNLALVSDKAKEAQKDLVKLNKTVATPDGGFKKETAGLASRLGQAGAFRMVGDVAAQVAGAYAGSRYGEEGGTMFNSMLSSAGSGMAMGYLVGGAPGAVIGGLAGGALGMVQGGTQIAQKQDDAFRDYSRSMFETVQEDERTMLQSGSAIAAGRETSLISFSTLLGGQDVAKGFLNDVRKMANITPFLYEDLTAMSKTLKTFKYNTDEILPMIQKVGDAGAALGMLPEDMNWVSTSLGRMKSTNKASLEYINPLIERGIDVYGYLADAKGVSREKIASLLSKGKLNGEYVAKTVLNAMGAQFAGSMEAQSRTMAGLQSTLQGAEDEMSNAMGEGYNSLRSMGYQARIAFLDIETEEGKRMADGYRAMGSYNAYLENEKERMITEAQKTVLNDPIYQAAIRSNTTEGQQKAGEMLKMATVKAENEYYATVGKDNMDAQRTLVSAIQENTAALGSWKTKYELEQEFTKGLVSTKSGMETRRLSLPKSKDGSMYEITDVNGYTEYVPIPALAKDYYTPAQYEGPGSGPVTVTQNISFPNMTITKEVDPSKFFEAALSGLKTQAAASAPYKKG